MLGLLVTYPVTKKMHSVSSSDLDRAGAVGFEIAAKGEIGIHAALRSVHDKARDIGTASGPKTVFGFFHGWLLDEVKHKPFGPIKDTVRTYILEKLCDRSRGVSAWRDSDAAQKTQRLHAGASV